MTTEDLIGGKYRITRRLGAGATGTVWAAIDERTGHKVALKLLSGETLADLLSRKRRLEPDHAAMIGRDLASALSAAHDAGIVHGGLTTAKIFLHPEGGQSGEDAPALEVLDLGVRRIPSLGDLEPSATGTVTESPGYLSPEQIQAALDVDPRTDVWSLGVILFELLTGERPFQGDADETIRQILTAPIPTPASRVQHVPPGLDAIVTRCLSRDREDRYPDTRELARSLAELAAAAPGGPDRRPEPARSHGLSEADARATAKTVPEIRRSMPPRADSVDPLAPTGPAPAARGPVENGPPPLAAAAVTALVLLVSLLLLLTIRGASSTPATPLVAEAPPPPSSPAAAAEPSPADGGSAPTVAATPPPPKHASPRAPQPALAAGNSLPPCTRLLRKNCRLVQP
jgi:serine/threonine-protein kinase